MPTFGLMLAAIAIGEVSCVLGMVHHPTWFLLMAVLAIFHEGGFVLGAFMIVITAPSGRTRVGSLHPPPVHSSSPVAIMT